MIDLIGLISGAKIKEVARINRACLSRVARWIDDESYRSSLCGYGIRECLKGCIDRPVGDFPTYTDAMLLISSCLKKPVRYLEIGVSVGKNFFQVADFLTQSTLIGLDIEQINPVLAGLLSSGHAVDASLTEFSYPSRENRILYLRADLRDERAWDSLAGARCNLIFSDAVHTPQSILHEFRMIERHGVRDPSEFVMFWDDLSGPMNAAFDEIWFSLEREGAQRYIVPLNGWLGVHEPPHMVGIIAKLP